LGVVKYSLEGVDAAYFMINTENGDLSFVLPADYETPTDADDNNEYVFDIIATLDEASAKQSVVVKVKNIQKPILSLVSPQANSNVGKGENISVDVVVKLIDQETKEKVINSSVTAGSYIFTQDATDPLLWKAKVNVPTDGITLEVMAELSDKTTVTENIKYFNKKDAIKPLVMGINPGAYVMIYDPFQNRIAKVNLVNNLWTEYVKNAALNQTDIMFDFNSSFQHAYTFVYGNQLVGAAIGNPVPSIFYAGAIDNPINITYDGTNKRILVLTNNYSVVAVGADDKNGFASAKTDKTGGELINTPPIWAASSGAVVGTFKSFNFHRVSKTFVIADEREINGVKRTVIQGFSEVDGKEVFKAEVGPDISNMAINNNSGIVYVAENKSSLIAGKLKTITISTGEVGDLGEIKGNITISNYSDIRMDNSKDKNKLYIGDAVSDSIYEINLLTKVLTELPVKAAEVTDVPPGEDN
jgi:hypothetical protein